MAPRVLFIPSYPRGLDLNVDGFGQLITVERSPVLSINAALPLSTLRNVTAVAGSAAISETASPGEIRLRTTASGTDTATLDTRQCGRYTPGYAATFGMGLRRPTTPVDGQVWRAGLFDGTDGFIIQENASGVRLQVYSNAVVLEDVPQSSWNVDKMDGQGASGLTLDFSKGLIFQVDFTYYGYGAIYWYFVVEDPTTNEQLRVLVHRSSVNGLSTRNPNLPIRVYLTNGGTATAFDLFVGGRQYSVVGVDFAEARVTSASRLALTGVGTTPVPLVSFQPRVSSPRVPYNPESFDSIADADHVLSLWLNPTLTGANFTSVPGIDTTDTMLSVDLSASAMTGGIKLWEGLAISSTGQSRSVNVRNPIDLGSQGIITLAARRISGANMTISSTFRIHEHW